MFLQTNTRFATNLDSGGVRSSKGPHSTCRLASHPQIEKSEKMTFEGCHRFSSANFQLLNSTSTLTVIHKSRIILLGDEWCMNMYIIKYNRSEEE